MTWNRSGIEAGDTVQQVRELTTLIEASIWFRAPTPGTLQLPITPASRSRHPLAPRGTCEYVHINSHRHTHICIIKKKHKRTKPSIELEM